MMQVIKYPATESWSGLLVRPQIDHTLLERKVAEVLADIKINGDAAIRKYTLEFDQVKLAGFVLSADEIDQAETALSEELKTAIRQAALNIETFHALQVEKPRKVDTMPGVTCWRRSTGIEKVGLYIPGGTAPLFSTLLMLGIPARLAGCPEVILCTPPGPGGSIHPAILFTAKLVGITRIFRIGGIPAIAAMAFGSETIPAVYKIFGPGNQYVNCAKRLVNISGVSIDVPAGPSELAVLADDSAIPEFVAADLLSQAEHGPDSQVMLITWKEELVEKVMAAVNSQLADLPRVEIARKALQNSRAIILKDREQAIAMVNAYAPEHLIINCREDEQIADLILNAGSVFLGNYSPESAGDYASGTNHTLPTNGSARVYSGVSVDSFVKKISLQKLSREGLKAISQTVELMASTEGLEGHSRSVRIRLKENG